MKIYLSRRDTRIYYENGKFDSTYVLAYSQPINIGRIFDKPKPIWIHNSALKAVLPRKNITYKKDIKIDETIEAMPTSVASFLLAQPKVPAKLERSFKPDICFIDGRPQSIFQALKIDSFDVRGVIQAFKQSHDFQGFSKKTIQYVRKNYDNSVNLELFLPPQEPSLPEPYVNRLLNGFRDNEWNEFYFNLLNSSQQILVSLYMHLLDSHNTHQVYTLDKIERTLVQAKMDINIWVLSYLLAFKNQFFRIKWVDTNFFDSSRIKQLLQYNIGELFNQKIILLEHLHRTYPNELEALLVENLTRENVKFYQELSFLSGYKKLELFNQSKYLPLLLSESDFVHLARSYFASANTESVLLAANALKWYPRVTPGVYIPNPQLELILSEAPQYLARYPLALENIASHPSLKPILSSQFRNLNPESRFILFLYFHNSLDENQKVQFLSSMKNMPIENVLEISNNCLGKLAQSSSQISNLATKIWFEHLVKLHEKQIKTMLKEEFLPDLDYLKTLQIRLSPNDVYQIKLVLDRLCPGSIDSRFRESLVSIIERKEAPIPAPAPVLSMEQLGASPWDTLMDGLNF